MRIKDGLRRQSQDKNTQIQSPRRLRMFSTRQNCLRYSVTQRRSLTIIWTLIRPAQALTAIQTLKDWEEQQDDSTQQVFKELKDLEKCVRALQLLNSKQTTPR